jgi:antitoxin component of MazEF toxin-antitoxin module
VTDLFEAKLRKIGNSLGVIIPNEILQSLGYDLGDTISIAIPLSNIKTRNKHLESLAGIDKGKPAFKREKKDRF